MFYPSRCLISARPRYSPKYFLVSAETRHFTHHFVLSITGADISPKSLWYFHWVQIFHPNFYGILSESKYFTQIFMVFSLSPNISPKAFVLYLLGIIASLNTYPFLARVHWFLSTLCFITQRFISYTTTFSISHRLICSPQKCLSYLHTLYYFSNFLSLSGSCNLPSILSFPISDVICHTLLYFKHRFLL
jgi:hypothetical protein